MLLFSAFGKKYDTKYNGPYSKLNGGYVVVGERGEKVQDDIRRWQCRYTPLVGAVVIMLAIPQSALSLKAYKNNELDFEFKWADNCNILDIESLYADIDTAPYGRFNYVFSNVK